MNSREVWEYNKLTWPEMNDAIEKQRVVILPTGSTEQHGPHLPLDTDLFLCESICRELARRAPDTVLLLPGIPYGLNMHHFDFPGTIHVEPQHFIDFGESPPRPTWGNMLYEAQKHMRNAPWLAVFPGTAIAISVLGLNLFGDAVRDAMDPRMRT